jgi:hypothetical protein
MTHQIKKTYTLCAVVLAISIFVEIVHCSDTWYGDAAAILYLIGILIGALTVAVILGKLEVKK